MRVGFKLPSLSLVLIFQLFKILEQRILTPLSLNLDSVPNSRSCKFIGGTETLSSFGHGGHDYMTSDFFSIGCVDFMWKSLWSFFFFFFLFFKETSLELESRKHCLIGICWKIYLVPHPQLCNKFVVVHMSGGEKIVIIGSQLQV